MNEDQILNVLARRAIKDEENRIDGPEGGALVASSWCSVRNTWQPVHMQGQQQLNHEWMKKWLLLNSERCCWCR